VFHLILRMARPSRNNADYFTHNADLRNDRRIKAIRARFGPAGYGLVVMLLEALTDADFTQLNTEELEMELLAGDFGVSVTEIYSLLQLAEKIEFFTRNEAGFLICPDLNKALEPVFEKRNKARFVAQTTKEQQSVAEMPVSVTEIPQSKVKKSKVKDTNVSKAKRTRIDESKQTYRENVWLKPEEHEALITRHGLPFVERCLDKLSSYKLAHEKEYKSDYGAINSWVIEEIEKSTPRSGLPTNGHLPKPSLTPQLNLDTFR
jgi:hypothetical protein